MPKTKKQLQEEAIEREEARAARSKQEQVKLLNQRPGKSKKERAKLDA